MDANALAKATRFSHGRSVAQISRILARHAGYSPQEVEFVHNAAQHDSPLVSALLGCALGLDPVLFAVQIVAVHLAPATGDVLHRLLQAGMFTMKLNR